MVVREAPEIVMDVGEGTGMPLKLAVEVSETGQSARNVSNPSTRHEVHQIAQKLDELINALKRQA